VKFINLQKLHSIVGNFKSLIQIWSYME